jgi:hypothetical protein
MDQEIEQLLHSLNVTTAPVEQRARPVVQPVQPRPAAPSWFRRHEPWILWVGGCLLLVKVGILAFFLIHGVPERWVSRGRKVLRIHESSEIEQMAPLLQGAGRVVWSPDASFPSALPEGSLANGSLFKEHFDILQAASGRRKSLEEIRRDIDALMVNCIHAPDRTTSDALRRALVRFDLTDLDLTHSVISMILSKRPLLKTSQDVQQLDETLSLAGLGRGLKEYSAMSSQMASTKKTAHDLLSKLETDRDVVHLANNFEACMRLLESLYKNPTIASSMDVQSHRRAAMDQCRHSLEQIIALGEQQPRRLSSEERLAVGYLRQAFPEISIDTWARLDTTLLPIAPARLAVHTENSMGDGGLLASSSRIMLSPDVFFPMNISVADRVR